MGSTREVRYSTSKYFHEANVFLQMYASREILPFHQFLLCGLLNLALPVEEEYDLYIIIGTLFLTHTIIIIIIIDVLSLEKLSLLL